VDWLSLAGLVELPIFNGMKDIEAYRDIAACTGILYEDYVYLNNNYHYLCWLLDEKSDSYRKSLWYAQRKQSLLTLRSAQNNRIKSIMAKREKDETIKKLNKEIENCQNKIKEINNVSLGPGSGKEGDADPITNTNEIEQLKMTIQQHQRSIDEYKANYDKELQLLAINNQRAIQALSNQWKISDGAEDYTRILKSFSIPK